MSPRVGKHLDENHRISHRYLTSFSICDAPVGAGEPAKGPVLAANYSAANTKVKRVGPKGLLFTSTRPPCSCMIDFTIANPNPVPPSSRERPGPTR